MGRTADKVRRMWRSPLPLRQATVASSLLLALMLSACSGDMIPRPRTAHKRPQAARPAWYNSSYHDPQSFSQCTARLMSYNARYTALPDRSYGAGCATVSSVQLLDVGVRTTGLGPMTCQLAANFAAWAHYGVRPAARSILGSDLVRIETMGTYNCRNVAGTGNLSEHARGNAIDIAGFLLADGRRISVRGNWNENSPAAQFLRVVRTSACKRFRTVLSPDFNADHHDHLHFDMGGKGIYCR